MVARRGCVLRFRIPRALVCPVLVSGPLSGLLQHAPPLPSSENQRRNLRAHFHLLLLRSAHRSAPRPLPVLRAGLLPESSHRDVVAHPQVPERLAAGGLRGPFESRRRAGSFCGYLALLQAYQDECDARARQHGRHHTSLSGLHSTGQSDEFRNSGPSHRHALGIYFCPQWRGLCPSSGATLRKSDLPAHLHRLPVCLSQAGPPCGEWLLLRTVSDEHFHLPLLH